MDSGNTYYLRICLFMVETNTTSGSAGTTARDTGLALSVMTLTGKKATECSSLRAILRTIIVLSDDIDRRLVLSKNLTSPTAAA